MKRIRNILSLILFLLPFSLLAQKTFPFPEIPVTVKGEKARANYQALHYWDNFDFRNNALIGNRNIAEMGFLNFVGIMTDVTRKEDAFDAFASKLVKNSHMLQYFMELGAEKLANPLSPMYDDALYIMFLEKIIAQEGVPEREYENARFNLSMANKNRVGAKAANFSYLKRNGKRSELGRTRGKYILLFMGDPECDICSVVKKELATSHLLEKCIEDGLLTVLSVCVEGETEMWKETPSPRKWIDACDDRQMIFGNLLYDIPGLPVLYLLDRKHRVVMKNAQVSQIEEFFRDRY